ncbi:TniQ family protein [Streptomyces griseoviridis]
MPRPNEPAGNGRTHSRPEGSSAGPGSSGRRRREEPRTLAIRVLPQPGESLDSWLEALARRSWTALSALLDALGLPTQERTHHLLTGLPPEMFQRLKKRLNLRAVVLEQSVVPAALFGRRAPHWRFCPQCLSEGQGRFPIRWWLPWTFACTKHFSTDAAPAVTPSRACSCPGPFTCTRPGTACAARAAGRSAEQISVNFLPSRYPTGTPCCRPRSRLETHAERPAAARRRTFCSLTPAAHQAAATTTRGPAALKKTTNGFLSRT